MKLKIEFDFGIGVSADYQPLNPVDVNIGLESLENYVSGVCGGCSIFRRHGVWYDNSILVREPGITLTTVVSPDLEIVADVVSRIKRSFFQRTVLVTITPVTSLLL